MCWGKRGLFLRGGGIGENSSAIDENQDKNDYPGEGLTNKSHLNRTIENQYISVLGLRTKSGSIGNREIGRGPVLKAQNEMVIVLDTEPPIFKLHLKYSKNRVQPPRSKAERNTKPSCVLHGKCHYPGEHREPNSSESLNRNGPGKQICCLTAVFGKLSMDHVSGGVGISRLSLGSLKIIPNPSW